MARVGQVLTLLPAVDVADGRVVRLAFGAVVATSFRSPRDAAFAWQRSGAAWVHLVDVDAAFGTGTNRELLAGVIGELGVAVQLSAGVRDDESLAWALSTGCARVVIGASALADRAWCARVIDEHGPRIVVALDVQVLTNADGVTRQVIAPRGARSGGADLWATLRFLDGCGCGRYVLTDVGRDGALSGPNLDLYRAVCEATGSAVVASGGVSSIDDLRALAALARDLPNLDGVIVGSALHAGRFDIGEALAAVRADG